MLRFSAYSLCLALVLTFASAPLHAASNRPGASSKAIEQAIAARKKLVPRVASDARKKVNDDSLVRASIKNGPIRPTTDQSHRRNFPDPKKVPTPPRKGAYPWHFDITATYFYIGERPTERNPTPNTASSWDSAWDDNYGGFDDPNPAN
ncbi:MAG: hypothetical protein II349_00445, partial [Akkermansia sp.]|nr:hypothetical protein [Akkermansia sp.]